MKGFRFFLLSAVLLLFSWTALAMSSSTVANAQDPAGMKRNERLSQQAQVILSRLMAANQINAGSVQSITVIEDNEYNAATDGKTIYFTDTLWNAFNSDDQRAFVIGHELSHIKLGHIKQTTYRRAALGVLSKLVFKKGDPRLQQVEDIGLSLIDLKFSRKMEYAADDTGMQIMTNAKYNPKAAMEAFEILNKHETSGSPEFLRSHPLSGSRIRELSKKYSKGSTL